MTIRLTLCDANVTQQTDRQTDRQTTCDCKTALCTVVHRAVLKSIKVAKAVDAYDKLKENKNSF